MSVSPLDRIARDASLARVPMSHAPRDTEYLSVLAYRIAQEARACEARLAALAALASDVAALLPCVHCGGVNGYHACDAEERGEATTTTGGRL